jgi:phosphodiesterase/alkaline phosphatase D-like protein
MTLSKNAIIGILVAAVIILGAAYAWMVWYPATIVTVAPGTPNTGDTTGGNTTTNPPVQNTPVVPSATTNSGTDVSNSTAFVTGKVNPDGWPTTYWFEYGGTASLGAATQAQSIGSGFTALPATGYITGLNPNTTYYFRIAAKNAAGTVRGATFTFTTNNVPPTPGNAPTTHSTAATNVTRTTANLNGSVDPNGISSSYWFEYGESSTLGNSTALQSAGSGTASQGVSVSVSNLKPLTKYYFRINAQNQYGTVNGSILTFTTTGPAAPSAASATTKSATGIATSSATVNGSVNPNGVETTYWFEYSTDSLLGSLIGSGTSEVSAGAGTSNVNVSAHLTNLSPNTRYYFRLVARNSFGTVRGDISSFKTDNN